MKETKTWTCKTCGDPCYLWSSGKNPVVCPFQAEVAVWISEEEERNMKTCETCAINDWPWEEQIGICNECVTNPDCQKPWHPSYWEPKHGK